MSLQTSHVFNQQAWPGAGDVDDCWVVSAVQLANVSAPWLTLASVPAFRKAAGDPDDGKTDGGNLDEIMAGLRGAYPSIAPYCRKLAKVTAALAWALLLEGRPLSVAVISSALPANLRFGYAGPHQVTLAIKSDQLYFANPLAPRYSSWIPVSWSALLPALAAHAGAGRVNGVSGPTQLEAVLVHPMMDTATAKARVAGAAAGAAALAQAKAIVGDAAAKVGALKPA